MREKRRSDNAVSNGTDQTRYRGSSEVPASERLIDELGAAEVTGMSVAWFQRKRWSGGGPPFRKIGASVRYQVGELLQWFACLRQAGLKSTKRKQP